ncbi:MAG TPA: Sec-independent protein translocase subunit TatA [Streptosporangiaceae bacterium]
MNIGDLFDSPWKVAIIAIVILVLFGSKKLPGAARSLGQSMRILKREVQGLHEEDAESASAASDASAKPAPAELTAAPAAVPASPAADQQAQIDSLQQQIRDMQRAAAMDPVASSKQDAQ